MHSLPFEAPARPVQRRGRVYLAVLTGRGLRGALRVSGVARQYQRGETP